jgi:phosphopantothenate synthetase
LAGEAEETTLRLIVEMMRSYSQMLKAVAEIEEAGRPPFDEILKNCSAQKISPKCATECPQTSMPYSP